VPQPPRQSLTCDGEVRTSDKDDAEQTGNRARPGTAGCFSCVVDENPRFHLEAIRWYATLTTLAGVAPGDLVVHVVGDERSDALNDLRRRGVTIRPVPAFDPRSPHCNKISGAQDLADDPPEGLAVLCDTDIVVLDDPRSIDVPADSVAAKVVDAPVPPLEVLQAVFDASGLDAPPTVALPWGTNERTLTGNSNGGLYLIPGRLLPPVVSAWSHWARWLLDRAELLGRWAVHVDQVSMALALTATGTRSTALDVRWNTPTHDPTRIPRDAPEPSVIHYHQQVDLDGHLLTTGVPSIDRRIATANRVIDELWPNGLPSSTYQEWLATKETGSPSGGDRKRPSRPNQLLQRGRRIMTIGKKEQQ
jgi:hypothetical protein